MVRLPAGEEGAEFGSEEEYVAIWEAFLSTMFPNHLAVSRVDLLACSSK